MTAPSGEELQPAVRGLAAAAVAAIIIGTLYFGREVFVPIALAILLSFVHAARSVAAALAHSAGTIRHQCRFHECRFHCFLNGPHRVMPC